MRISDWSSDVGSSDLTGPQGESGSSAAEGATAPETLRQKDQWADGFWKETLWASADGITISGKQTEGAHSTDRLESAPVPYILVSSLPPFIWEIGRASCRERVCQYV